MLDRDVPRKRSTHADDLLLGEVQRTSPATKAALAKLVHASKHPNAMFVDMRSCIRSCWYAYRITGHDDLTKYGLRKASYYRLAERLRDQAEVIECVNASLLGSPVSYLEGYLRVLRAEGKRASLLGSYAFRLARHQRLLESARGLPDALRDYATSLRLRVRKQRKQPIHRNVARDQWVGLVDLIVRETGDPHYAEAARILEAVAFVAGNEELHIEPRTLADVWRRHADRPGKFPIVLDEEDPERPFLQGFVDSLLTESRR